MATITPIETIPPLTRSQAATLAATEYRRLTDQLQTLSEDDWSQPTACPQWDVRAVAGHCVGMMSDFTSLGSVLRRQIAAMRVARRRGIPDVDAMTSLQVADHAAMSVEQLIARAEQNGPRAARWRATAPRLLRRMPTRQEVAGTPETWRIGYLLDTILTRDPWMHRTDIARATGRELTLTPDHDGAIVADVVAEWARRHGRPFHLTLTGPAGGEFTGGGGDGEKHALDAIEFCRILSGRGSGPGLLSTEVPF